MKKSNTIISALLPSGIESDVEQHRRYRFFVTSCLVTALFATGYGFMSIYVDGMLFAYAMAVSVVVFISLAFMVRRGVPLHILENLFVLDIVVVVILLIYWGGGIRISNLAPWPLVIPIFALLMQGPKRARKWFVIAIVIVLSFSYYTFRGITFPVRYDVTKDPLFNMLSLTGIIWITTSIFYISENQKRQAQQELKKQNAQLENLNNEKDNFLRIVSHDLKSPALIITEFAKYLAEPDLTEEEKVEYLQHIANSGERMLELIRNLLDINMIESGKMSTRQQPFSVKQLVIDYISQVDIPALNKGITITSILPDEDVAISSDKARLVQVLDNYVSNAIKYCPEGTKVFIQLRDQDSFVELSVRDEGPGIAAEELKQLFVPFSTASSVPRAGYHSSGLGLAIVKKIADSLGASVGGDSDIGRGSTFHIRFPLSIVSKPD